MARKNEDLEKATIRLYRGDKERLNEYYPSSGYNAAIRKIVHKHLAQLDKEVDRRISDDGTGIDLP